MNLKARRPGHPVPARPLLSSVLQNSDRDCLCRLKQPGDSSVASAIHRSTTSTTHRWVASPTHHSITSPLYYHGRLQPNFPGHQGMVWNDPGHRGRVTPVHSPIDT
jgi:hypothetical protein